MPEIPEFEKAILTDMMADCSNKTAKALSEMIQQYVDVAGVSSGVLLINDVPKLMNPENIASLILFTKLRGKMNGAIMISATIKNMLKMADIFLHKPLGHFKDLSDENASVIKELGNILAGYYITALNRALQTNYASGTPILSINPHRAIEEIGLGPVYTKKIYVLVLEANLRVDKENINENITILFKKESTEKILELLLSRETREYIQSNNK